MLTTVTVDDKLLDVLRDELGISEATELVELALIEMRQRLAARRLIALAGSDPGVQSAPRRRPPRFVNPD